MSRMFKGCSFLTDKNIITNDQRIINQFFKDNKLNNVIIKDTI